MTDGRQTRLSPRITGAALRAAAREVAFVGFALIACLGVRVLVRDVGAGASANAAAELRVESAHGLAREVPSQRALQLADAALDSTSGARRLHDHLSMVFRLAACALAAVATRDSQAWVRIVPPKARSRKTWIACVEGPMRCDLHIARRCTRWS